MCSFYQDRKSIIEEVIHMFNYFKQANIYEMF